MSQDSKETDPVDEPVPRLPRGRFLRIDAGQLMTIALLVICLVAIIFMRNTCASGAGHMLNAFDEPPQDPSIVPTAPTE